MAANHFSTVTGSSHYRQFRASLDWLSHELPYQAVLGCDTIALSQHVKRDIQSCLPGLQTYYRWQGSDDFAKAFTAPPGSSLLLDFATVPTKLTDRQIAEQLLFYRDKAVQYRLNLICITTLSQLDRIHSEAFDFVAAASFTHAFEASPLAKAGYHPPANADLQLTLTKQSLLHE